MATERRKWESDITPNLLFDSEEEATQHDLIALTEKEIDAFIDATTPNAAKNKRGERRKWLLAWEKYKISGVIETQGDVALPVEE